MIVFAPVSLSLAVISPLYVAFPAESQLIFPFATYPLPSGLNLTLPPENTANPVVPFKLIFGLIASLRTGETWIGLLHTLMILGCAKTL